MVNSKFSSPGKKISRLQILVYDLVEWIGTSERRDCETH